MVRTASTMLPLGTPAPDFSLPDTEGKLVSLKNIQGENGTLVMFICNHCPFVIHVAEGLSKMGQTLQSKGVGVVAINSNDVENYPEDAPDKMAEEKARQGYTFPYLFDESQAVAHAYRAACTPDFFLFDKAGALRYRGQMDSSRPGSDTPVTGCDILAAADAMNAGAPLAEPQYPSLGCNIKWKASSTPEYFSGQRANTP